MFRHYPTLSACTLKEILLTEMIMFLECLRDAQLPLTLESLREKLLVRSKDTLSVTTIRASSPEPYLDMKSGPRSLLLTRSEADSQEYVGMEEHQKHIQLHARMHTHQDYYETFENESQAASVNKYPEKNDDRDKGQTLIEIYKNLSAMQIRGKCYKCGPLYRKEGKKLFLSERGGRACWIALVGSHLLIYRSERHDRPYAIYPILGYMARPAPNMIPRDRRKGESAFEMYSPGNETLQFIARTPKDMDQWVTKICEVGCGACNHNEGEGSKAENREKKRAVVESPLTETSYKGDEVTRHRDGEKSVSPLADKSIAKTELTSNNKNEVERKDTGARGKAPPLPARIPRRLPSLPPANSLTTVDDDDDDDIYHSIQDLRNETPYQNMLSLKKQRADTGSHKREEEEAVTYDDVRTSDERNERNEKVEGEIEEGGKSCDAISFQETYDDIVTLSRIDIINIEPGRNCNNDASVVDGEGEEEGFYDDVEVSLV